MSVAVSNNIESSSKIKSFNRDSLIAAATGLKVVPINSVSQSKKSKKKSQSSNAGGVTKIAVEKEYSDYALHTSKWYADAGHTSSSETVYLWNGNHLQHVGTEEGVSHVLGWLNSNAPNLATKSKAFSCWGTAASNMRSSNQVPKLDSRHFVPCQGVYLEIEPSGRIVGHDPSPSYGLTYAVKVDPLTRGGQEHAIKPLPINSKFRQFLEHAQPDPAVRGLIQEQCGMTLLSTNFSVASWWYGVAGSGKSTLSEICGAMQCKVGATRLNVLSKQFGLESLVGMRLIRVDEVEMQEKFDEGLLKTIISGNGLYIDRKLEKALVDYHFNASIIITSNMQPFIRDKSDGMWRRLCVIHWANQIPAEQQDTQFLKKVLATEGEAILDWMLEGAVRIIKRGRFQTDRERPSVLQGLKDHLRNESDNIRYWVDDNRVFANSGSLKSKDEVLKHYQEWCMSIHIEPLDMRVFWKGLSNLVNYKECKKRVKGRDSQIRVVDIAWLGGVEDIPITEQKIIDGHVLPDELKNNYAKITERFPTQEEIEASEKFSDALLRDWDKS